MEKVYAASFPSIYYYGRFTSLFTEKEKKKGEPKLKIHIEKVKNGSAQV